MDTTRKDVISSEGEQTPEIVEERDKLIQAADALLVQRNFLVQQLSVVSRVRDKLLSVYKKEAETDAVLRSTGFHWNLMNEAYERITDSLYSTLVGLRNLGVKEFSSSLNEYTIVRVEEYIKGLKEAVDASRK
ncbi:hypothetical protein KKC94_04410 [Patescibacteria group bacterium]|nr:hypothetical protein [Patescibacteria group bacterium]